MYDPGGIVWIRRARVGAIQPVDRRSQCQVAAYVPLGAYLVVVELLGLDLLCDGGQRRKLIARAGQIGDAVIAVKGNSGHRLEYQPYPRGYQAVNTAQGVAGPVIVIPEIEMVEAEAEDSLQMDSSTWSCK